MSLEVKQPDKVGPQHVIRTELWLEARGKEVDGSWVFLYIHCESNYILPQLLKIIPCTSKTNITENQKLFYLWVVLQKKDL